MKMWSYRIARRINGIKGILFCQKIVLCFTILSALRQLLSVFIPLSRNARDQMYQSVLQEIGSIDTLMTREKFYREILLDDRNKHNAIYETWFYEDKNGRRYVTSKGKCKKNVGYNYTKSEQIALNRDIWDTRHKDCASFYSNIDYSGTPSVTVIIPFHNENFATVMRTVHSVLHRSPPETLREILLIDDGSTEDMTCMKEELEKAVFTLAQVRLIRTVQREGSTVARLLGAAYASSDVISYLDSHVEVNYHWLDPIITRIKQNDKAIVMSILDTIENEDFELRRSFSTYTGAFNWNLEFYWAHLNERINAKRHREIDPIPSAIMPAGAFALRREWFVKLGMFDPHMRIWGVDDVEFSFRAWQCGSTIEILPCSRVAHIFRYIPYSFEDQAGRVIFHNGVRTAEVTLESYKKFFYAQAEQFRDLHINLTSLRERAIIKQELNCKDFAWFMQNVIPEMPLPPEDAVYYEKIKMKTDEEKCLTYQEKAIFIADCVPLDKRQIFYISSKGHLVHMDSKLCIVLEKLVINVHDCSGVSKNWVYNARFKNHLSDRNFVFCLAVGNKTQVEVKACKNSDKNQMWSFSYHFDWSKQLSYLQE